MSPPGPHLPEPSSHEAWISDEKRVATVARRVAARAMRRPILVLAVALLGTGAYLASRFLRPPFHLATVHFRLSEGNLSESKHAQRPPRAIREYIRNVALSRDRLRRIMEKYNWSTAFLARSPAAAIDEFREEIGIEVSQNYFIYDRSPDDAPRSAQIAISLRGSDREKSLAMLQEIGDAILQEQAQQRGERFSQGRDLVEAQLASARSRTKSLQETIGRLRLEGAGALGSAIAIRSRMASLEVESKVATEQVIALERLRSELEFSASAESVQPGLSFERVDENVVESSRHLAPAELAARSAIVFLFILGLVVPVVGTFDDRIYAPEDLADNDLPLFGAVPRFQGDEAGSCRERMLTRDV